MTTAKATSAAQINDLIGLMRKNNRRDARAARSFIFEVQKRTLDSSSKCFIHCLYMKAIRAKQLKVQLRIIAKYLTQRKVLF